MGPAQGSAFEARRRQRSITASPASCETPAAAAAAQNALNFELFGLEWSPKGLSKGLGSWAILKEGSVFGEPILCEGSRRADAGGAGVPQRERARATWRRIPSLPFGRGWCDFGEEDSPRLTFPPPLDTALAGLQM